jgi:hypothetical protein
MSDSLASARLAFGNRYYQWCVQQLEEELRLDFQLLRRLREGTAIRYLAWADSLSAARREAFARSMLGRMFRPFSLQIGLDPSSHDPGPADQFLAQLGSMPPASLIALEQRRFRTKDFRLERRPLWAALKTELAPLFPKGYSAAGGGEWLATTEVHGWKIVTRLDLGGTIRQVGYDHAIRAEPNVGSPALWDYPISVFTWLGVTGQTDLNYFTADDMPELTSVVYDACARFLNALPVLLHGIDPVVN